MSSSGRSTSGIHWSDAQSLKVLRRTLKGADFSNIDVESFDQKFQAGQKACQALMASHASFLSKARAGVREVERMTEREVTAASANDKDQRIESASTAILNFMNLHEACQENNVKSSDLPTVFDTPEKYDSIMSRLSDNDPSASFELRFPAATRSLATSSAPCLSNDRATVRLGAQVSERDLDKLSYQSALPATREAVRRYDFLNRLCTSQNVDPSVVCTAIDNPVRYDSLMEFAAVKPDDLPDGADYETAKNAVNAKVSSVYSYFPDVWGELQRSRVPLEDSLSPIIHEHARWLAAVHAADNGSSDDESSSASTSPASSRRGSIAYDAGSARQYQIE